jgi:hypothetical protein
MRGTAEVSPKYSVVRILYLSLSTNVEWQHPRIQVGTPTPEHTSDSLYGRRNRIPHWPARLWTNKADHIVFWGCIGSTGEHQQILCGSNQELGYIANLDEHSVPRTYYHLGFPHCEDRKGNGGSQLKEEDGADTNICTRQLRPEDDIRQKDTIRTHLATGTGMVYYTDLPPP